MGWLEEAVAADDSFKPMQIPLVVYYGDRKETHLVVLDQPQVEFRFELPQRPKKVAVDPERYCVRPGSKRHP